MSIRLLVPSTIILFLASNALAESPVARNDNEGMSMSSYKLNDSGEYTELLNVQIEEGRMFYGAEPMYSAIIGYSNFLTGDSFYCQELVVPSDADRLVMDRSATHGIAELDVAASQCYPSQPAFTRARFECTNTVDSHQFVYSTKGVFHVQSTDVAPGNGHGVYHLTQRNSFDSSCVLSLDDGRSYDGLGEIGSATDMLNDR